MQILQHDFGYSPLPKSYFPKIKHLAKKGLNLIFLTFGIAIGFSFFYSILFAICLTQ